MQEEEAGSHLYQMVAHLRHIFPEPEDISFPSPKIYLSRPFCLRPICLHAYAPYFILENVFSLYPKIQLSGHIEVHAQTPSFILEHVFSLYTNGCLLMDTYLFRANLPKPLENCSLYIQMVACLWTHNLLGPPVLAHVCRERILSTRENVFSLHTFPLHT